MDLHSVSRIMTTGYFRTDSAHRRPHVDIEVSFPEAGNRSLTVMFLIDTGADSTILSSNVLVYIRNELGIEFFDLPVSGTPISGLGGYVRTRTIRATLTIGSYRTTMPVPIMEPPPGAPMAKPSLLGMDILHDFALFIESSSDRVMLLDAAQTEGIAFPAS